MVESRMSICDFEMHDLEEGRTHRLPAAACLSAAEPHVFESAPAPEPGFEPEFACGLTEPVPFAEEFAGSGAPLGQGDESQLSDHG